MQIKGVTQAAVHRLRLEIISGELHEGARLNEVELSSRLGISRPPLREAFRRLENEGLVVSIPRKGCYVVEISVEDWKHIARARKMLEATAIEIMEQEGITDFPLMRQAQQRAAALECPDPENDDVSTEEVVTWFNTLSEFHLRLVESSGNTWLTHCYKRLFPSLSRYQIMYLSSPGAKAASIGEHMHLLGVLEAGNYQKALGYLEEHVGHMCEKVMQGILQEEKDKK